MLSSETTSKEGMTFSSACGFLQLRLELAAMPSSELHETRSGADILVDRIPLVVCRNNLVSGHVGHRGGNLLEGGAEQVRDELLRGAPREHVSQSSQPRGIVDRQPHRILRRRARRRRALSPAFEQLFETHESLRVATLDEGILMQFTHLTPEPRPGDTRSQMSRQPQALCFNVWWWRTS